jgi:hypothetical protein
MQILLLTGCLYLTHPIWYNTDMNEIVSIEPYIAPDHKELLDEAYRLFYEYDRALLDQITNRVIGHHRNIRPSYNELAQIEREYIGDNYRAYFIKRIADMKLAFERPRVIIKN